jgi:hypothetical protein
MSSVTAPPCSAQALVEKMLNEKNMASENNAMRFIRFLRDL